MSKIKNENTLTKKKDNIFSSLAKVTLIGGAICIIAQGYHSNDKLNLIIKHKDEIIAEQTQKYDLLFAEHQKSQALITATTNEVKRLSSELRMYKGTVNKEIILDNSAETANSALEIVSKYIQENESFSSIPYYDSDGKYRNGYGTLAKNVHYKIGDTVKVKNRKGKIITLVAKEGKNLLPERKISVKEAITRKSNHIKKEVFPYLYGKTFRSEEEFIVATDVIYNRGIGNSKALFNSDGTINCKTLYNYMTHSKKEYQKTMRNRYAKNYALCIQS